MDEIEHTPETCPGRPCSTECDHIEQVQPVYAVDYAYCVAIRVKYLGPTNYRGSRWRVWRGDDTYAADPDSMELGYNHALNASDNACAMVRAYLAKKAGNASWAGRWVVASHGDSEYVAVKAGAL